MLNEIISSFTFFGVIISLAGYFLGMTLKKKFKLAIFNPLLTAVIFVMLFLGVFKIDYAAYETSSKYISFFLTPATVCLAIPLYEQISLLKKNAKALVLSILAGSVASCATVFILSLAFGLNHEQYVTLLPKSITTAIGMGVSQELGGITSITAAVIIITGILGNMLASFVCRIFGIKSPIAKGVAIGTASHAIGTSRAMEIGEIEGAMSSLAIAVAGIITVIIAPIFSNFI